VLVPAQNEVGRREFNGEMCRSENAAALNRVPSGIIDISDQLSAAGHTQYFRH
jgi:hypothetical protein